MLMKNLDIEKIKNDYSVNRVTRIDNLFEEDVAIELANHVASKVPFKNAFMYKGTVKKLSNEEFRNLSSLEQRDIHTEINKGAAQGFGFMYGTFPISDKLDAEQHGPLTKLYAELNSTDMVNIIKQITEHSDISGANSQATRYTPGQFLTRHNDVNPEEVRRVAYVISLTPTWHPDWGGLLQFFEQDGTPTFSLSPKFNSMTLFDVQHPHSVTYVAPYASHSRLSVTGWFNAK